YRCLARAHTLLRARTLRLGSSTGSSRRESAADHSAEPPARRLLSTLAARSVECCLRCHRTSAYRRRSGPSRAYCHRQQSARLRCCSPCRCSCPRSCAPGSLPAGRRFAHRQGETRHCRRPASKGSGAKTSSLLRLAERPTQAAATALRPTALAAAPSRSQTARTQPGPPRGCGHASASPTKQATCAEPELRAAASSPHGLRERLHHVVGSREHL